MAYTTIDKPDDYFNTVLYTGTGASNSVTGVGFQSDLLWFKNRSSALNHILFDSVRGIDKYFYVNLNEAEGTSATILTAVGSDGFTVGANDNVNENTKGIVSWNWLANGAGVSNTAGTISSTVSANTTSGFSIVSYTGTGSNATVGHGLGVAPKMVIVKGRSYIGDWKVYNSNVGATFQGFLNGTEAFQGSSPTIWNSTAPTSTVFSIGTNSGVNTSGGTIIAYCFAEVKGFSKFGSYTGNGSADGTFMYTGFKPAFVMLKRTNDTAHWQMQDSKRIGFNPENERLYASDSAAEQTINFIDLLSNGFKCITTDAGANGSGDNFIYMAFAENPFVTSTSIPTTAR
jgi:hypothetical protein